jgi:hypothetical protein
MHGDFDFHKDRTQKRKKCTNCFNKISFYLTVDKFSKEISISGPEYRGNIFVWSAGTYLPGYTVSCPRNL